MIGRLVLQHEIVHNLAKPLLVTVTTVSLVLNILAFQMARDGSSFLEGGFRGSLAQFCFLVPLVVILLLGKSGTRCRPWEAGLPVGAKSLWWSHLLALVLATMILTLVSAVTFLLFAGLMKSVTGNSLFYLRDLLRLVVRPAAASVAAACLIAAWRPRLGLMSGESGWFRQRYLVIGAAGVLLGLLLSLPPVYVPVFVVLVVALAAVRSWRVAAGLPAALEMADREAGDGGAMAEANQAAAWSGQPEPRRVVRMMILRTLFKWPMSWLVLGPFAILFGLIMSGYDLLGMEEDFLRYLNFFLSVYILFSVTMHFMENLYRVDSLPIDRKVLLRWLVIPMVAAFVFGYGVGMVLEMMAPDRSEKILFNNAEENYGVRVSPAYFDLSTSSAPNLVSAPWGETHEVMTRQVFKGLPGWLWKSFDTPRGSSREFVAWQISRAAVAIYGLEIEPEEISTRYLESDLEGRVTVRPEGLTLAADYPTARPGSLGPVFPLLVGGEIVLLLVVMALYFQAFKPGVTIRKSRVVFWLLMGGLMALHFSAYSFFVLGWTKEWLIFGFWMGRIRELGAMGPVGFGAAWLGMFLLLGAAWRWAERSFLAVEAPSR